MADYPDAVYSPRLRENKAGVSYDAAKKTIWFKEDSEYTDDEIIAIQTELGTLPKGAHANVKARFVAVEASLAAHIAGVGAAVHGDSYLLNTGDTGDGNYILRNNATHQILQLQTYSVNLSHRTLLNLEKSHSDVLGTLTATVNGEMLGGLSFRGVRANNPVFQSGASILGRQKGAAGADYIPAQIEIHTSPGGAQAPLLRGAWRKDGGLKIGAGTAGNLKLLHIDQGSVQSEGLLFAFTNNSYRHSVENIMHAGDIAGNKMTFNICDKTAAGQTRALQLRGDGTTRSGTGDVNFTETKADGEINMHGTARVINHIIMPAEKFKIAGLKPASEGKEGIFPTLDYVHTAEKEAYAKGYVPFRWDSNTDVEVRIDWLCDADGTGGDVVWGIDYKSIKDNEAVAGGEVEITQAFTGAGAGLVQSNYFTVKLLKANLEADDIIGIRVFRDTADAGDTLAQTARMLAIHLHFTRNKIGEAI